MSPTSPLSQVDIACRISHARHFQHPVLPVGLDGESSVVLRHGSLDESGIGTGEQHDIDERHRLRMFVDDSSADGLRIREYRDEASRHKQNSFLHHAGIKYFSVNEIYCDTTGAVKSHGFKYRQIEITL